MTLKLYNTFSNKVEEFKTLKPNEVSMYICGVTPYDTSHLGHAFVFTFFDTLKRFLTYKGYNVTYVQNVTDIDDPLIEKAQQLKTTWQALADKWTEYLLNDFRFLNIMMPDYFVKATQELPQMVEIIKGLQEKGFAYEKNGTIYFDVAKFDSYGRLSKYTRGEMITISAERGNDIKDPHKKKTR